MNIGAIFWIITVDGYYGILVLFFNSLLMSIPFIFVVFLASKIKHYQIFFILVWTSMEFLYSTWDIAFPWLNFGNVLSNQWYLISWYSIIGTYGGTIWVLLVGLCIYKIYLKKVFKILFFFVFLLFTLPIYSLLNYHFAKKNLHEKVTTVLTYNPTLYKSNYKKIKTLYEFSKNNELPQLILTSELFLDNQSPTQITKGDLAYFFKKLFIKKPKTVLFIGSEIVNSQKIKFNGMAVITADTVLFRVKKKYVPITEFTPHLLKPFFGDSYYSKNVFDDTKCILNRNHIMSFICFESLFSVFFAEKTIDTKFIFLSTSEAFLNESAFAKRQYVNLARLRAIECGRNVLKCSYHGTSCLIDPNGKIIKIITKELQTVSNKETEKNTIYQKIISNL